MTDEEAGHNGLIRRMERSHELLAAPSVTARALTVSAPLLLNTGDLHWESVEHLVAWLARRVEGWEETWLYGERGQNQHGIDVVGVTGQKAAVFQAKRLKEFTAYDLECAADRYARGKRPFGASRLVVVTTHDANRTEISEKLFELRGTYPDLQIELWNRKRLSDLLLPHPDIVTAFFGAATTQLFCPVPPAPALSPAEANEGPDAQALLRGPVAHLGLEGGLAAADEARQEHPATAAAAYGRIAEQLEQTLYRPYARALRARQAAALHAAGDTDMAVRVDVARMARDLVEDRAFEARAILLRLAEEHVEADDALVRTVNTLGSLAEFEFEHHVTLDDIAAHLDVQMDDDPSVLQAATLFAEHALAERRTELVTQRIQRFTAIAETSGTSDLDTARLQACLADADPSGDAWRELHRTARHTYPIPVRGLLAARRARFLATTADMHGAVDAYYDAVELALAARTHQDAGEWLAAQRLVLSRSAQALADSEKIFSAHGFEQVLRQASRDSVLPALQDTRASAMFDLAREKFHDARQHLLQYRRRAVAMGSWGHQCEAEQLLARLHVKVGNTATAMTHLMNSGVADTAKAVRTFIPELPAQPLDWPTPQDLATRPTWERTCAFAITERMADALTDTSARTWIDAALQAATEATLGTDLIALADAAWGALAKLAPAATSSQAQRTASLADPDATPTRFTTMRAQAWALATVSETHDTLAPAAVERLTGAVLSNSDLINTVVTHSENLFIRHPQIVAKACTAPARQGSLDALRLLLLAEAEPLVCREVISGRLSPDSDAEHGDRPQLGSAELVLLGEQVLPPAVLTPWAPRLAAQVQEPTGQSEQGWILDAMTVAALTLPRDEQQPYVELALRAARGELTADQGEELTRDHPLDRFRFGAGPSLLPQQGLVSAARLAGTDPDTAENIVTLALTQLRHAADAEARLIARALNHLTPNLLPPLTTLAVHHQPWIRCLATSLSSADNAGLSLCRNLLADDPDWRVRVNLARNLPDGHSLLARLRQDANRQVRQAAARRTTQLPAPNPT
ncbi:hypothetical protein ABZV65_31980 [Streptomyces bauhiniae]|uniref:hypothetical protein n=1 Tax=Streptomyces bauhiniae TaxID=2340725 RepID=UPI0033A09D84